MKKMYEMYRYKWNKGKCLWIAFNGHVSTSVTYAYLENTPNCNYPSSSCPRVGFTASWAILKGRERARRNARSNPLSFSTEFVRFANGFTSGFYSCSGLGLSSTSPGPSDHPWERRQERTWSNARLNCRRSYVK